jgi:5'-nucleotidase
MRFWFASFLVICASVLPANARNIVLTNDDGLTSNIVALYNALKADGHDVIVSIPCQGQSGMGGAVKFMRPLGPLAADCLNGAAHKGDPGAGPATRAGLPSDFYYVDGTPVMATLYGLDVLAAARWGKAPDLVLSGPNEGQNLGYMVLTSGTVSNAQYGMIRGIPSIAVSAGIKTTGDDRLANPASADVARLTLELVRSLEKRSGGKRLLPPSMGLNVNFPDKLEGAKWQLSQIGTYEQYKVSFSDDIGKTDAGTQFGMASVHLPGVVIDMNRQEATSAQTFDESIVFRKNIAVSPMQLGYEPAMPSNKWLKQTLRALLEK